MGNRQCTVVIKNTSEYTLRNPRVYIYSGQYKGQFPSAILPNQERRGLFVKTTGTACGAVGVITYDLFMTCDKTPNKIAIMFSAPYNHDFYDNLFAIGVLDKKRDCNKTLYVDMYYNNMSDFCRYHADGIDHEYVDRIAVITARMTKAHDTVVKVEIKRPNDEHNE